MILSGQHEAPSGNRWGCFVTAVGNNNPPSCGSNRNSPIWCILMYGSCCYASKIGRPNHQGCEKNFRCRGAWRGDVDSCLSIYLDRLMRQSRHAR